MQAALQTPCRLTPAASAPRQAPRAPARSQPVWPPLLRGQGLTSELIAGAIAVGALIAGPWIG